MKGGKNMNEKIEMLLDILLQQNEFITATQLAEILNVSERSVRNYVHDLNGGVKDALISSSNQGYKIQKDMYKSALVTGLLNKNENDLLFEIAFRLMDGDEYTSFDKLSDQVHYSSKSIRKKVQQLFLEINQKSLKLKIDSKIFTGIRMDGEESQKRLLLEMLLPIGYSTKDNITDSVYKMLSDVTTKENVEIQSGILDEIFSNGNVSMDFMVYVKILCHMIIFSERWRLGHKIKESHQDSLIRKYSEYEIAKKLLKNQPVSVENEDETDALAAYLLALPINIPNQHSLTVDDEKMDKINEALREVEEYYKIPVYSNEDYRYQIANHILRLLYPLKESIPIFNPYAKETKVEYFYAYSIACYLYAILKRTLKIKIPDSELAYLATRMQLILLEAKEKNIQTLVIYSGKLTESKLFEYKLKTRFPSIRVDSLVQVPDRQILSNYRLIIVVGDMEISEEELNIVRINHIFNQENIEKVQNAIDLIGTSHLIKNLDYYHMNVEDSKLAIEYLIKKSGYDGLLPYFFERESMSSTDIGNKVALPHPFLKGSETLSKVIIGINSKDILWGNQKVRLIIVYIPDKNLKIDEAFFNEVYQKTKNLNHINKLIDTNNKQEFIKIWNEKGAN